MSYMVSDLVHYLDDFISVGPPNSLQCAHNLDTALNVCRRLGLPLHPTKCVRPTTCMVDLGTELDSVNQIACLPAEKLLALQDLLFLWVPCCWCDRWQLESLIGHLHLHCQSGLAWPNLPASHD